MVERDRIVSAGAVRRSPRNETLCLETQGREVMAKLVHDVVAEAMRLDLHGTPPGRIEEANGAPLVRSRSKVRNG
jgi:hypothetical protein